MENAFQSDEIIIQTQIDNESKNFQSSKNNPFGGHLA